MFLKKVFLKKKRVMVLLFTLNKYLPPGKLVCFTEIIKRKQRKENA